MKAETEATWVERVEAWRGSGKSAAEFTADKSYASSTLQWAASRLRRAGKVGGQRGAVRKAQSVAAKAGGIAMAKVIRSSRRGLTAAGLVIEVAGARISVHSGFDATLLHDVVQAIRGGQ